MCKKTLLSLLLLVSLLVTSVGLSSCNVIDDSYRYDLADLSVFYRNGAVIDYAGLSSLPITLEANVTRDEYLKKIQTNMTGIDGVDAYKKKEANLSGISLPYPDIVYMYYEIFKADADGNIEDTTPILSNTSYFDSAKATSVRLGSGDFHLLIENFMRAHPEWATKVVRNEDVGDLIEQGYTRVIDLTATYDTETTKDGETTISTNKYLTLSDFNLEIGWWDELIEKKTSGEDGKMYYVGATTFKDVATEIKDHAVSEELSYELLDKFAKLERNGDEFVFVQGIKLTPGSNEVTEVTFKGKVTSNFLAEVKEQTFELFDQYTLNDEGDGFIKNDGILDFEYKDASGTTQKIDINKQLVLRITVESVLRLDEELVLALTEGDAKFTAPESIGENRDAAYALQYMEYVKKTMLDESVARMKQDAESFASNVKNALWQEILALYATDAYINSFPIGEIEKHCDALMDSYDAEFKSSGPSYANTTEYVLTKIYELENVTKMTADEQKTKLNEKLTEDAEKALRKEILLFTLADRYGIEITKDAMKAAKEEIYEVYLQLYTAYYSGARYATYQGSGVQATFALNAVQSDVAEDAPILHWAYDVTNEAYEGTLSESATIVEGEIEYVASTSSTIILIRYPFGGDQPVWDGFKGFVNRTYGKIYEFLFPLTPRRISRMVRKTAKAMTEETCTPSFLREYVALSAVQDALVPDALNYPNVTWVLSGEAD